MVMLAEIGADELEAWFTDNGAYGGRVADGGQWENLPREFRDALLITYVNLGKDQGESRTDCQGLAL
ncbi:MAG: hypothetical protein FWD79_08820 [Desulfobulbus sp.]|nr:hypothetical protein [Desulfobulbus sp.]